MSGTGARQLHLTIIAGEYAVCRLSPEVAILPTWAFAGHWYTFSRTDDELSIACPAALVPDDVQSERDWCLLRLTGPFPFGMTGVLSSVLVPLAEREIPIFAVSTYDTDYILVKTPDLARAADALREAGHLVDEG
jgi:hypothetical protein